MVNNVYSVLYICIYELAEYTRVHPFPQLGKAEKKTPQRPANVD